MFVLYIDVKQRFWNQSLPQLHGRHMLFILPHILLQTGECAVPLSENRGICGTCETVGAMLYNYIPNMRYYFNGNLDKQHVQTCFPRGYLGREDVRTWRGIETKHSIFTFTWSSLVNSSICSWGACYVPGGKGAR